MHFHAPTKYTCAKNDQYEGESLKDKQAKFIKELKSVESISVMGITDYFSLDGYKLVQSHASELTDVELILPNIELRITPVTGKNRKINLHLIANTEVLSVEEIERFLYKFEVGGREKYTCLPEDLIRYGKQIDDSLSEEEAFKRGLNEFYVGYDNFFEVLHNMSEKFKENVVVGVSNDSKDGASGIKDLPGVRNIIYSGVDFIFSPRFGDRKYFLGLGPDSPEAVISKYGKFLPCFHGSDYHGSKDGSTICVPDEDRHCWIKADPTFEGLKQVLYEPLDRVKIQATIPEDKPGYQVIDRVEIDSDSIYNSKVALNPNLSSIIGGRSSGKSVFLGAIAKKLKSTRPFRLSDKDYQEYVQSVSDTIRVIWKDGKEENEREVEYFEQGYMHDIARDESALNKIIEDILVQKGKETLLDGYDKFVSQNSKAIAGFVSDYFMLLKDINDTMQKVRDKGDKEGVEDEIKKLKGEENKLSTTALDEEDKSRYEEVKQLIETATKQMQTLSADIKQLESLQTQKIVKESIDYELISLSDHSKEKILELFDNIKAEAQQKWQEGLDKAREEANAESNELTSSIAALAQDPVYLKGLKAFKENAQLTDFETRIKNQEAKLFEIKSLLGEVESLKKELLQTKSKIKQYHKRIFEEVSDLLPNLSDFKDGLEIKANLVFKGREYTDLLNSGLNLQSWDNQQLANFKYENYSAFEEHQFVLFEKLENNSITLKGSYSPQSLTSALLSSNFFKINYDIEYEGDDFKKMSDGKKAFVVLKLLLDFNDKDCPILIDQPEDDLDNRAIYNDLVQYLRNKKQLRQIVVATHNPNIVVGADSELVICANQHGEKNMNTDSKKFQYVTGSLEHTFPKIDGKDEILECQGTREHVCEVLEGGNAAFKLRERKYSIKE